MPPGVVTVTSTVAAVSDGAVAVIEEAESAVMMPDDDPKRTDVAPERFVPVMVTAVPPAVGPDDGLVPTTVGGGGGAVAKV